MARRGCDSAHVYCPESHSASRSLRVGWNFCCHAVDLQVSCADAGGVGVESGAVYWITIGNSVDQVKGDMMRNTKSIVREVFLFPAHLIWVAWRVSGADNDDMTFSQIWKSTYDEFVAETSTRGRFAFALLGSIGIYAVCVMRAIKGG